MAEYTGVKPKGDVVILKEYFGLKEDEDLKGFLEELKKLSSEEKTLLADGIRNGSFTY
jgi:predicted CopG family antitoxin